MLVCIYYVGMYALHMYVMYVCMYQGKEGNRRKKK